LVGCSMMKAAFGTRSQKRLYTNTLGLKSTTRSLNSIFFGPCRISREPFGFSQSPFSSTPTFARDKKWTEKFKAIDKEAFKWKRPEGKRVRLPEELTVSLHKRIKKKAKAHLVFPDVLTDLFTPRFALKVEYPTVTVGKGSPIPFLEVAPTPKVSFDEDKATGKFWSLLLTCPDNPNTPPPSQGGPRSTETLHWLIVNIPGGNIEQGESLCSYQAPLPPQSTAFHRYVFVLFEQKEGKIDFGSMRQMYNDAKRENFNTNRFK